MHNKRNKGLIFLSVVALILIVAVLIALTNNKKNRSGKVNHDTPTLNHEISTKQQEVPNSSLKEHNVVSTSTMPTTGAYQGVPWISTNVRQYGILLPEQENRYILKIDPPQPFVIGDEHLENVSTIYIKGPVDPALLDRRILVYAERGAVDQGALILDPLFYFADDIIIPRSFGCLHYPARWIDTLVLESTPQWITFNAQIGPKIVPLFTFYESDRGEHLIGKMRRTGYNPIMISFTVHPKPSDLDDIHKDLYDSMLEDINYILQNLKSEMRFMDP